MNDSERPIEHRIIWGCSRLFLWSGAAIFFVGGKFLYEIKHKNFLLSEMTGILAGTLLMFLGWAVRGLDKSVR